MNWFQLKSYLKYLSKAGYRRGHRIHPPFAFYLVRHLFYEKHKFYHFDVIDELREDLLLSDEEIKVNDFGAGSKKFKSNVRSIKNLVKYNATSKQQGELISRLVNYFKPHNIIELGTSLGIGSMYLAMPNSQSALHTIEGCSNIAEAARKNFNNLNISNIYSYVGDFKDVLPGILNQLENVDMVYFDGHHDYQVTLDYFNMCLEKASSSALFIFDDIYWSKGMTDAWKEIVRHPQVSVSFDLFHFGIAILKKEVKKQHYMIRWP